MRVQDEVCGAAATRHSIPSDLSEVDGVCREVRALLERQGVANRSFAVDLLLREFLNNAILHGNRSDTRKRVQAAVRVGRKWIVMWIADEGPGFDWRAKRLVPADDDAASGRGLAIGALYAQRLKYNRAGNQVTSWIWKTEPKETTS
jgi:serine/threonine-protein kinase RsbW